MAPPIFRQHRNRPEHIHDNELNYIQEVISAAVPGGSPEFSYFHSQIFTQDNLTIVQPAIPPILQHDAVGTFDMFRRANFSPGSGITSSGSDLQFINTASAGTYKFHLQFSVENTTAGQDTNPDMTITLADGAGTPYTNPTTALIEMAAQFEPTTTVDQGRTVFLWTMSGVITLPAAATSSIFISGGNALTFAFGTFNLSVERLI